MGFSPRVLAYVRVVSTRGWTGTRNGGGVMGPGLTCGVVPHHKEEGSVHDDLLGGHSG